MHSCYNFALMLCKKALVFSQSEVHNIFRVYFKQIDTVNWTKQKWKFRAMVIIFNNFQSLLGVATPFQTFCRGLASDPKSLSGITV